MGIFSTFKRTERIESIGTGNGLTGIVSPWASDDALTYVTWAEHFQGASAIVSRPVAMTVGAVARGRALIGGALANSPLRAYRNGAPLERQPTFLYRTNTNVSPQFRTLWTLDDLLFFGDSLWIVERGASDQITDAYRIPRTRWTIDADTGRVKVDGKPASSEEVLYFNGPQDGLLKIARNSILGSLALEQAWIGRAQNPIPALALQQTERDAIDEDDVRATIDAWSAARTSATGAVGFVPYGLKAEALGTASTDMFEKARNAIRLDFANFMNVPASMLEGSANSASLTYENRENERNSFLDTTVKYWASAFEARLSMDDVLPAGQSCRFDFASLIEHPAPANGAPVED
jgi:hypothetical protein